MPPGGTLQFPGMENMIQWTIASLAVMNIRERRFVLNSTYYPHTTFP
jgi:hypothetical protein